MFCRREQKSHQVQGTVDTKSLDVEKMLSSAGGTANTLGRKTLSL